MRLTPLRGSLAYYERAELSDEPGAPREVLGRGLGAAEVDLALLEGAPRTRVGALDVTVACPKDVSVLWALASGRLADGIERAHRVALARTLAWLERLDLSIVVDGEVFPNRGALCGCGAPPAIASRRSPPPQPRPRGQPGCDRRRRAPPGSLTAPPPARSPRARLPHGARRRAGSAWDRVAGCGARTLAGRGPRRRSCPGVLPPPCGGAQVGG